MVLKTFLPNWGRARLEVKARLHAVLLACERDMSVDCTDDVDRLAVNMLRHEYTDYDYDQSASAHRAACLAISEKFPWLAAECGQQMGRRSAVDVEEARMIAAWEVEVKEREEFRKEFRTQRMIASSQAIQALEVGMTVDVRIKGHDRIATIVAIGRTRVVLAYAIKTGAKREVAVYAICVSPSNGEKLLLDENWFLRR